MKRVLLFVATNLAIVVVLGVVMNLLGIRGWLTGKGIDYKALLVFSVVIGFTGSFVSLALSKFMARHAYGIQIIDQPRSEAETFLFNSVREQAERAGIRMPQVGVYESPEVNAFATGPSRNNALVAVSSGLIRGMQPRQIQGVLAHEVGHIANGDMVTMTLLQGVLNTFVIFLSRVLGFAIDNLLRRGDDQRSGPGVGYFVGYLVCEIVLGILASLIVFAYSRRREFRADALGAKLEGKDAMIGALRRLQEITERGGVIDNRSASFNAFKINHPSRVMRLFATHPPLGERIAALEQAA